MKDWGVDFATASPDAIKLEQVKYFQILLQDMWYKSHLKFTNW